MDEYLFLTVAKLKADRKKLEQEQRERTQADRQEARPAKDERESSEVSHFVPFLSWR